MPNSLSMESFIPNDEPIYDIIDEDVLNYEDLLSMDYDNDDDE